MVKMWYTLHCGVMCGLNYRTVVVENGQNLTKFLGSYALL